MREFRTRGISVAVIWATLLSAVPAISSESVSSDAFALPASARISAYSTTSCVNGPIPLSTTWEERRENKRNALLVILGRGLLRKRNKEEITERFLQLLRYYCTLFMSRSISRLWKSEFESLPVPRRRFAEFLERVAPEKTLQVHTHHHSLLCVIASST